MENVDSLILEHLRAIRTDIGSIKDDVRELKLRVGNLEVGQATMMQHLGHHASVSAQQRRGQVLPFPPLIEQSVASRRPQA